MAVNDQSKTVELVDGIDAGSANSVFAVLGIPELEVTSTPFGTSRSELELCSPFRLRYTIELGQYHQTKSRR